MPSGLPQYEIGDVGPNATVLQGEHIWNMSVNLPAAEIQKLTKAAEAGDVAPLTDRIIDLAQGLGVTQGAALAILRALGQDDISVERLPDMLAAAATQILVMRQTLSRPSNDESGIVDLKREAVSALDAGAFGDATRILNVIRAREQEASERQRRAFGLLQVRQERFGVPANGAAHATKVVVSGVPHPVFRTQGSVMRPRAL